MTPVDPQASSSGGDRDPERTPSPIPPPINSTPISNKLSGTQHFSSVAPASADATQAKLANEISGRFIGPWDPMEFLKEFLPSPEDTNPLDVNPAPVDPAPFLNIAAAQDEKHMYAPFIESLSAHAAGFEFIATADHPDPNCGGLNPDVCLYKNGVQRKGRTDFSKMEMWVEFKKQIIKDAFCASEEKNVEYPLEGASKLSQYTKGQIASYATAQMGTQFRTHALSLLIVGEYARFIYWERAGAAVSERFNYTTSPQLLVYFIRRFTSLTREQRGYDGSVSDASANEIELAKKHLDIPSGSPMYNISVPDIDPKKPGGNYIVASPPFEARSPFGRATRPMLAYDLQKMKAVFLKDYWRKNGPEMEKEGDIYVKLHEHEVPHIAPFDRGNDVGPMTTLHKYKGKIGIWKSKDLSSFSLYRLALGVVGRKLWNFRRSSEYIRAIAHAMEDERVHLLLVRRLNSLNHAAHQVAYDKAKVLHRDVSAGNIILLETEGLLIDWDLAISLPPTSSPRQPDRSGTWQFISAARLLNPKRGHGLEDDRESALHVLNWISLRFTKTNLKPLELRGVMRVFDEAYLTEEGMKGGQLKKLSMTSNEISGVEFDGRPQLSELINELTSVFSVRYETPQVPKKSRRRPRTLGGDASIDILTPIADHSETDARTEDLMDPTWLVDTVQYYLNQAGWPKDDAAEPQDMGVSQSLTTVTTMKRTSDQAQLQSNLPGSKSLKLADGTNSRDSQ